MSVSDVFLDDEFEYVSRILYHLHLLRMKSHAPTYVKSLGACKSSLGMT